MKQFKYFSLFFIVCAIFAIFKFHNSLNPSLKLDRKPSSEPASEEAQCNGSRLENDDPMSVIAWLRNGNNLNRSIDQVICCMPESLRDGYKVVHSSISAQRSHYHSPRVLFGSIENGIMFSISGGDPTLPQSESIEVMYDNPRTGQLELFDIEYLENGNRHVTGPNPQTCIQCHGNNGEVGVAGPRPIFNQFPWPRTASIAISDDEFCPNRSNFLRQSQETAFEAVSNNPRFRCLPEPAIDRVADSSDPAQDKVTNLVSFGIDAELANRNEERVLREMTNSEDFFAVRHFVAGVTLGCFSNPNVNEKGEPSIFNHGGLEQWLAPGYLESFNQTPIGLNSEFENNFEQEQVRTELLQADATYRTALAEEESQFLTFSEQLANGQRPQMPTTMGLMGCIGPINPDSFDNVVNLSGQIENANLRQHFLNSAETGFERGFNAQEGDFEEGLFRDSLLRWAFEGRGISTDVWDMEVRSFNPRSLMGVTTNLPEVLRAREQLNSGSSMESVCNNLRARSLAASSRLVQPQETDFEESGATE